MSPLPNVAALLATGWGRVRLSDRSQEMAAALVEAADALRNARDPASSWNIDDKVRTARIQHYVDPVLARLVAFDASLEKTT